MMSCMHMCVGYLLKLESVEICHAPVWHYFAWPSDDLVLFLFVELSVCMVLVSLLYNLSVRSLATLR
jgi:hypothetical protein